MLEKKYIIIIAVIICLIILYYFYDEISNVKKLFVPTYQKTMALEAKIMDLEKKAQELLSKKKSNNSKIDSPALSITYQSDMVKNGNLSVKYIDISDTEGNELLRNMGQNYNNKLMTNNQQCFIENKMQDFQSDKLSDFMISEKSINKINNMSDGETTIINKNSNKMIDLENKNTDANEYQKILNGLTNGISNIYSEDVFDDDNELDSEIIKSISESIKYADLPSETILSDIPEPKKKISNKSKKINTKKSNQRKK